MSIDLLVGMILGASIVFIFYNQIVSMFDKDYTECKNESMDGKLVCNTYKLNVRKKPSINSTILFRLDYGDVVIVLQEGIEEGWTKIEFGDMFGYVISEYLAKEINKNDEYMYITKSTA